jgi:hypothetical protein
MQQEDLVDRVVVLLDMHPPIRHCLEERRQGLRTKEMLVVTLQEDQVTQLREVVVQVVLAITVMHPLLVLVGLEFNYQHLLEILDI